MQLGERKSKSLGGIKDNICFVYVCTVTPGFISPFRRKIDIGSPKQYVSPNTNLSNMKCFVKGSRSDEVHLIQHDVIKFINDF